MKLTETQHETIETYLLSWELQFRDFYDEMFDHFCLEIEQRMSNGISFDNALADASNLFNNHEFRGGIFGSKVAVFFNVKAMEMERFDSLRKYYQHEFILTLKRQLFSWRILLWLTIFIGLLGHAYLRFDGDWVKIEIFADGSFLGGFLLGISLAFFLTIFSKIPLSETLFKRIINLFRGKELAKRKKYQLFKSARQHAFMNLFVKAVIFFSVIFQVYSIVDTNMSIGVWSLLSTSILLTVYGFMRVFLKHRKRLVGISV